MRYVSVLCLLSSSNSSLISSNEVLFQLIKSSLFWIVIEISLASEFLILELKRDKTSDVAVAQTLRYMGYIKKELATNDEKVKGCIIGTQEDRNLINAISMVPDLDFYRYKINFSLERVEF